MRLLFCTLAVSAVAVAGVIGGSTEYNPVRHRPAAVQGQLAVHRVIAKLRSVSSPTSSTATSGTTVHAQAVSVSAQDRVSGLMTRVGLTLKDSHVVSDRLLALQVEPAAAGDSIAATIARLRADPEVEYAEPDQRRYVHAVPNDTLYAPTDASHPGQWYMQNPATISVPAAVNAEAAWDISKGSANSGATSFVIADIDTGVRYDHPDLQGRLLPGYCFISDSVVNNGGTCLGGTVSNAEASDPGDYVTSSDLSKSECSGVTAAEASSWHGTRTAGILGAVTNNGAGIAAMTWQGQILPVRALGKCGGQDSDILSAMLWAAGLPVSGAPTNPTPAKIINMSLGGSGSCPASYQDVVNQITAKGVLVVVSAGNENGPVDAPANCSGVVGVAGLRQAGTKVGYSSFGAQVAISAPAGNCVNTTLSTQNPCVYPITSTTNPGTTIPSTSYTTTNAYTNQVTNPNLGTSFSAPIVSGIAALMSSVNHNLSSCQLTSRLQEGAVTFPTTSADETTQPPSCPQTDPTSEECICNKQNCGAGMANALGAVTAALRPIAAVSLPSTVSAGQSVTLDASGSAAAIGHTISTYQWSSVGGQPLTIQSSTAAVTTVTAPSCGYATLQVAVTDDAGRKDTANVVLSPTSATSTAPTAASATSCSASTPTVLVAVCPGTASLQTGATQSFAASVANATDDSVTWEVNGVAGGDATVGTITSDGTYMAPATLPSAAAVTVAAVYTTDSSVQGQAQVTFVTPTVTLSPTTANVQTGATQAFTATVAQTSNAAVTWEVNGVAGGNSTVGTISTTGQYTAPSSVPSSPTVTVTAVSAADASVTAAASVTISAPPKSSGGGALDLFTLLVEGAFVVALGVGRGARQYSN
jgi:serine protease